MSSPQQKLFSLTEVTEITGIDGSTIVSFIRREWVTPASENELDPEDLARIRLIYELKDAFGANDESIPLILHLMDQLYHLRHQFTKHAKASRGA